MNETERLRWLIQNGIASQKQMAEAGRDTVVAAKTSKAAQYRSASSEEVEVINEDKRVLRYVASSESPDRMGDIVRQAGIDAKHWGENPVILWGHDGDTRPPIGRGVAIGACVTRNGSPATSIDVEYPQEGIHKFADMAYDLGRTGFLKAMSIGFIPKETHDYETAEEAKAAGLGEFGVDYTGSELLESSVCSVPMNQDAVQQSLKFLGERYDTLDVAEFKNHMDETAKRLMARRSAPEPVVTNDISSVHRIEYSIPGYEELRDELRSLANELRNLRRSMQPELVREPRSQGTRTADLLRDLRSTSVSDLTKALYQRETQ